METRTKAFFTAAIGTVAAAGMLALTVYPFGYGVVESTVLVGAFLFAALSQTATTPSSHRHSLNYVPIHPLFHLEPRTRRPSPVLVTPHSKYVSIFLFV